MTKNKTLNFLKENRKFTFLWVSQILSQITLNMINFVMATRIYEKTGSTLAVSFLWIFYFLPSFFLGPFSGFFADILPLRNVLFYTNMTQAVVISLFLFLGQRVYSIYPVVFLYSLVNQFYYPAEAASIPWLVKKKYLPLANSLFMFTSQSALIFGIGLSGVLMKFFGKNNPIILSSVLLFLAAMSVRRLPFLEKRNKHISNDLSKFLTQIKIGYKFIRDNRIILFPILIVSSFQVMLVALGVTIPSFATELLHIKVADAGPLLIIPVGLGALTGTYIITKFAQGIRKKVLIKYGLIGALSVFMSISLILPILPFYKTLLAAILMYFFGLSIFLIFVPNQTLIQENTPPQLRGRVFGAWNFLSTIATLPLLLFSASIVDWLGIALFMFIAGLIVLFFLLAFNRVENLVIQQVNAG